MWESQMCLGEWDADAEGNGNVGGDGDDEESGDMSADGLSVCRCVRSAVGRDEATNLGRNEYW